MPRILDLYCGAGGCSVGYHRAGFDVVGVDINPQPNYPFTFFQDNALEFLRDATRLAAPLDGGPYDAIHASPPCQAYIQSGIGAKDGRHPELVEPTRDLLLQTGLPYVIENIVGAPLITPTMLCGSSFGLDVRRHRLFETNWPLMGPPCQHGWQTPRFRSLCQDANRASSRQAKIRSVIPVTGEGRFLASVVGVHGNLNYAGERELRERAMQIDWMTPRELTQAIPPAYTELIGHQLATYLKTAAA